MTTSSSLLTHYKVNEQSIDALRLVFISSQATAQNTKAFGPAYQLISVKSILLYPNRFRFKFGEIREAPNLKLLCAMCNENVSGNTSDKAGKSFKHDFTEYSTA